MDLLDRMLGHDHWATTQLLKHCEALTDEQLDQQYDIGRQSLRETLDHMIYTINFWPGWIPARSQAACAESDHSRCCCARRASSSSPVPRT